MGFNLDYALGFYYKNKLLQSPALMNILILTILWPGGKTDIRSSVPNAGFLAGLMVPHAGGRLPSPNQLVLLRFSTSFEKPSDRFLGISKMQMRLSFVVLWLPH